MTTLKVGSNGPIVTQLQNALNFLGYACGKPDGSFGPKTETAVEAFQKANNLYSDGEAGIFTITALNKALALVPNGNQFLFPMDPPAPDPVNPTGPDHTWTKVPADQVPHSGGFDHLILRDDVAKEYLKLYAEVHSLGGALTTAGGRRGLSATVDSNRSKTSMHYVGRAMDLATDTGMINPDKDQYIVGADPNAPRKWILWCRSTKNPDDLKALAGLAGTDGGSVTLNGCVATPHGPKFVQTTATAFNLTKLLKKYGFEGIRGRVGFWSTSSNGNAPEWWHFQEVSLATDQGVTPLIPHVSTFGNEMLKIYTLAECQQLASWSEAKGCVYGETWG